MANEIPYVPIFKGNYMSSVRPNQCRAEVHEPGRGINFHQCLRSKNLLEYNFMLFCSQHHPPSIAERERRLRKCIYKHLGTVCNTPLKKKEGPWCSRCLGNYMSDLRQAKVKAYDRIVRLLDEVPAAYTPLLHAIRLKMKLRGLPKLPDTIARRGSRTSPSSKSRRT